MRNSRSNRVRTWRELSHYFLRDVRDLDRAEEFADRVLAVMPEVSGDRLLKARILEQKGTPESLRSALATYDEIIAKHGERSPLLYLHKSRVFRTLGRFDDARAAAFRVVQSFPFDASMDMGRTALSALAPYEALAHFTQAREEFAGTSSRQRASADEAIAAATHTMLTTLERQVRDESDSQLREAVDALRTQCRERLDGARDELLSIPEVWREREVVRVWLARLAERRNQVRAPGETPCLDAAKEIEKHIRAAEGQLVSAALHARIGRLFLLAAATEVSEDAAKVRLRAEALSHFEQALGSRTAGDSRGILSGSLTATAEVPDDLDAARRDPELKARREHVRALLAITQAHLDADLARAVIEDPPAAESADGFELKLARRVGDAATVAPDAAVASVFRLLQAIAWLNVDSHDRARQLIDAYIASQEEGQRAQACVELARVCQRHAPGTDIVFQLLDRLPAEGAGPVDYLTQRLAVLDVARRTLPDPEMARSRLERDLQAAADAVTEPNDRLAVLRFFRSLHGAGEAARLASKMLAERPADAGLRAVLADLLVRHAQEQADEDERNARLEEALGEYARLFVTSPLVSAPQRSRVAAIAAYLAASGVEIDLSKAAPAALPGLPEALRQPLATATEATFLGRPVEAVAALEGVPAELPPFGHYLIGVCRIAIGREMEAEAARADTPTDPDVAVKAAAEVDKARQAFEAAGDYAPARLELLHLELQALERTAPVPPALAAQVASLATQDAASYHAHWLSALVEQQRFRSLRANDQPTVEVRARLRAALEATIERSPVFLLAYQVLAETYVVDVGSTKANVGEKAAADWNSAVNVLKSCPNPMAPQLARIAGYLAASGQRSEARVYRQAVALLAPSPQSLADLVASYVRSGELVLAMQLLGDEYEPPKRLTVDQQAAQQAWVRRMLGFVEAARRPPMSLGHALVRELREAESPEAVISLLTASVASVEGFESHRLFLLGEVYAARSQSSETRSPETERRVLEYYRGSLAAFEAAGSEIPMVVLNNLTWKLCQSEVEQDLQEALGLAIQLTERGRGSSLEHAFTDTYAWALFKAGREEEARQARDVLRELLRKHPLPEYRYHLAVVSFTLEEYDEAYSEVQKALESGIEFDGRDEATLLFGKTRAKMAEDGSEAAASNGS